MVCMLELSEALAGDKIGMVQNQFDNVDKALRNYHIPFNIIKYRELEDEKIFSEYSAIFFPCGVDVPIETNINILSRGTSIQAVFLKDNYYEIDKQKIFKNIKDFINGGGISYFSEFSYELLQGAFSDFEFFNNFPHIGMAGRLEMSLSGDLKTFYAAGRLSLMMPYSGFIGIKSVKNADALARGNFELPDGNKEGIIAALFRKGGGEAYYSGYHSDDVSNNMLRFYIYRLACRNLLLRSEKEAGRWDQNIEAMIVDSICSWESFRRYTFPVKKGNNTVYLKTDKSFFQMDVFDASGNLVFSRQSWEMELSQNIYANSDGEYIIKIYPSMKTRFAPYSIVTGSGVRLFPYWKRILLGMLFSSIVLIIFIFKKIFSPGRYSGRYRGFSLNN